MRFTSRWNCNFTHFLGKTKLISQFCPLKSVRFLLILSKFLLNIFIFLFDCQGSLCLGSRGLCFVWLLLPSPSRDACWFLLYDTRILPVRAAGLVGLDGLEPSTSRLSGARSNHLSYRPVYSRGFYGSYHCQLSLTGGDDGNRTHDPLLAGQVLSQLSYTPILGLL